MYLTKKQLDSICEKEIKAIQMCRKNVKDGQSLVNNFNEYIQPFLIKNSNIDYFLYALYKATPKENYPIGVGPGECLLGILGKNIDVSGSSLSYDLKIGNEKTEVKQGFLDKVDGIDVIWNFSIGESIKDFVFKIETITKEFLEYAMIFEAIEEGTNDLENILGKQFLNKETFLETLQKILSGEISKTRLIKLDEVISKIVTEKVLTIEAKILHQKDKWIVFFNNKQISLSEFIGKFRNLLKYIKFDNQNNLKFTDNKIMGLANEILQVNEKNKFRWWVINQFKNYMEKNVKKSWILINGKKIINPHRIIKCIIIQKMNMLIIYNIGSIIRNDIKPRFLLKG